MGTNWTERRIPSALNRNKNTNINNAEKIGQILRNDYALWVFVCAQGANGGPTPSKLYTIIDTNLAEMDLDSTPPRPSKSGPGTVTIPNIN